MRNINKYTNMNKILFSKKLIVIILMFIPLFLIGENKIKIRGKIEGLKDSTLIAIFKDPYAGSIISECYPKNGEFEINTTVNYSLSLTYIGFKGYKPCYKLLSYNDEIMITGDVKNIDKLTISGGQYMNDLLQAQKLGIESRFDTLESWSNTKVSLSNKELLKLLYRVNILVKSIRDDVVTLVAQKPGSPVSAYLFYKTIHLFESKNEMEKIMNMFVGDAKNTTYYEMLSGEFNLYSLGVFPTKKINDKIKELENTLEQEQK
jgi:hypothetical protein